MVTNRISGIYMIRNKVNDKKYIGLSRDCLGRISRHKTNLRHGRHSNCHLQAAWNKYGESSFEFSVIEKCDISSLPEREMYWIDHYDSFTSGYNRSGGGDGTTGVVLSEERNMLISKSLSGKKRNDMAGSNNFKARRIICLNNGERFDCVKDAAKKYDIHYEGIIRSCSAGCTVGDSMLVFAYSEDYDKMTDADIENKLTHCISARKQRKPSVEIVCVNNGMVFASARQAANYCGKSSITNIHKCCKSQNASCGVSERYEPLTWMYKSDYDLADDATIEAKLIRAKQDTPHRFRILCEETGEVFDSATAAANHYNISNVTLSFHLRNNGIYKRQIDNQKLLTFKIA